MTTVKNKPKSYPRGLKLTAQDWAQHTLVACENQYVKRMDCATVFALCKLAEGDAFDFVAFRYKGDDKEALAIVTESMQIKGMSLGIGSYIEYKDMPTFCQALSKHSAKIGLELIALREGGQERVYLEAVGIENSMHWSKDPAQTLASHRQWKSDRVLQDWSDTLWRNYSENGKLPTKEELLKFVDDWAQYNDEEASKSLREKISAMTKKEVKQLFCDENKQIWSWGGLHLILWKHSLGIEGANNG
jgi:hypothetical protein